MRTSPSYTAYYHIEVDEKTTSIASIVDAVSSTGAEIKGLDDLRRVAFAREDTL